MKQQTAVEWLVEQLSIDELKKTYTKYGYMVEDNSSLIAYAKEIEKEQMKKIFIKWYEDTYHNKEQFEKLFDNYYNETYKK